MYYDFQLAGKRIRLWQKLGESYEHVLMKALGYAMYTSQFPQMEIEKRVGLRYKPDLVAQGEKGDFLFWGEAGENSFRKTLWLLKHARVKQLVLFKININIEQFARQLRNEIPSKYRSSEKLKLINFVSDIRDLTASRQIAKVPEDWFSETII